ncbi:MAG: GTPase Era [Pseudomonadota bacterium]
MTDVTRAGRCAILGATNVGKSTLLNAIVGTKIAIVSSTVQTTRRRILGVVERAESQIAFVDTPGLHRHRGELNRRLVQAAMRSIDNVDAVVLVLDATRRGGPLDPEARRLLEAIQKSALPCVLVLNKIDRMAKPELLPMLAALQPVHDFAAMIPVSAQGNDGVDALVDEVARLMPLGPRLYDPDQYTDQTERSLAAEIIREKAMRHLRKELPHSLAVTVEDFDESRRSPDDGGRVVIEAVVWVERDGQKAIAIGAGGSMVKAIGTDARIEIESMLEAKLVLKLDVRVARNWSEDPQAMQSMGVIDE